MCLGEHFDSKDIVMLAPVSVHADYFHKHVGDTMLNLGIQKVKEAGFKGIIVEGYIVYDMYHNA